jgi:hypothetical protein
MPHVQKLLWAGFLFILGISGFCVSKIFKLIFLGTSIWYGCDILHAMCFRVNFNNGPNFARLFHTERIDCFHDKICSTLYARGIVL